MTTGTLPAAYWCVVAAELATDVGDPSTEERPPGGGGDGGQKTVVRDTAKSLREGGGARTNDASDPPDG